MIRACKSCHRLSEGETCQVCKTSASQYWSGYMAIVDPDNSEIARIMEIKTPGEYALKVR